MPLKGGCLYLPVSAPKRAKEPTRANCVSVYLSGLTGGREGWCHPSIRDFKLPTALKDKVRVWNQRAAPGSWCKLFGDRLTLSFGRSQFGVKRLGFDRICWMEKLVYLIQEA